MLFWVSAEMFNLTPVYWSLGRWSIEKAILSLRQSASFKEPGKWFFWKWYLLKNFVEFLSLLFTSVLCVHNLVHNFYKIWLYYRLIKFFSLWMVPYIAFLTLGVYVLFMFQSQSPFDILSLKSWNIELNISRRSCMKEYKVRQGHACVWFSSHLCKLAVIPFITSFFQEPVHSVCSLSQHLM